MNNSHLSSYNASCREKKKKKTNNKQTMQEMPNAVNAPCILTDT